MASTQTGSSSVRPSTTSGSEDKEQPQRYHHRHSKSQPVAVDPSNSAYLREMERQQQSQPQPNPNRVLGRRAQRQRGITIGHSLTTSPNREERPTTVQTSPHKSNTTRPELVEVSSRALNSLTAPSSAMSASSQQFPLLSASASKYQISSSSSSSGGPPSFVHELRRPDSVITTSSIVSSDTGESQASEVGGPTLSSAYASTGLYNHHSSKPSSVTASKNADRQRRSSSSGARDRPSHPHTSSNPLSRPPALTTVQANSVESLRTKSRQQPQPLDTEAILKCQSNNNNNPSTSAAASAISKFENQVMTHRRQGSHPVQGSEMLLQHPNNSSGVNSAWPLSQAKPQYHSQHLPSTAMERAKERGSTLPAGLTGPTATTTTATSITRVSSNCHRRSNSYGHHKALTNSYSLGATGMPCSNGVCPNHRRTGSSVIETLQTCMGSNGCQSERSREDSLAQFLENLKREQQEKYERAEMQVMQEELQDLRDCGLGVCRPKVMQSMASIKVFVFLLSILVTLQQALSSGYLNSVITTIEKRYEIPSSISGIIASFYELGNLGTVIFVSYLGSRRHIPAWIGMGCLVMGIGSITFSLPHFLGGNYMVNQDSNDTSENICRVPRLHPAGAEAEVLEQLPGLDKIKSLTEGLDSPPLGPNTNNFNREDNCIEQANGESAMPIFIFMIAQLLLGCGGSPLFTLGTTYIDNHVKRDDSSMYIGIMYSMCAFGPVCGFLLGAYLLSHYVDTFALDVANLLMDSSDRRWIGMWWGGFLIMGVGFILISVPFFFFPKVLKKEKVKVYIDEKYHHAGEASIRPKNKDHRSSIGGNVGASNKALDAIDSAPPQQPQPKQQQPSNTNNNLNTKNNNIDTATTVDVEAENNYGKNIKDIPKCMWKLLTNKIFMVTCLGACMELIIVSGFIVFLPKYLETQFNLSKSMASMFTGGIAIPGACIGIFFGGYILKRLQLRPQGAVQLVIFFNVLCLGCYSMLFFFGCDNIKMAGTTMPYPKNIEDADKPFQINLTASCNFGCSCDMNDVQPVCGSDGLTYFSPCHAGCTSLGGSNNYTNCACVLHDAAKDPFAGVSPLHPNHQHDDNFAEVTMVPVAWAGPCTGNCQMIMPFMVLLFFMTLLVAVSQMPVLMVVLRSVSEEEKAFALGIQFVIFRIFGYIPSPILFGNVIDSTCLLWKSTCAGEEGGRCLLYDIESFRYKYVGVCCGIKLMSLAIFVLDWWLIRSRQKSEKKEAALTVGEVVNSIISLDKLFEPEGTLWHNPDPERLRSRAASESNVSDIEVVDNRRISTATTAELNN